MDRITAIQEKQRKSRCRDRYLMKEKFEVQHQKKIKKDDKKGTAGDIPELEQKLHSIQENNLPNADPQKLFDTLKVSDFSLFLGDTVQRAECPQCKKKSKIYCADCLRILHHEKEIPQVQLPFKLTIIHHDSEKIKKSSALPACLLIKDNSSIDQCEVIHFPKQPIPAFDAKSTLILYPHKNSKRVLELDLEELKQIKNVVAIDCTWNQTNSIINELDDPNYKFVRLEEYNTTFWRYQFHQPNCLATIEAIYYFFREFDVNYQNRILNSNNDDNNNGGQDIEKKDDSNNNGYNYDGKYDDLLFFYAWNYQTIQNHYKENNQISFRKIKNYIKYEDKSEVSGQKEKEDIEEEKNDNDTNNQSKQEDQETNSHKQESNIIAEDKKEINENE